MLCCVTWIKGVDGWVQMGHVLSDLELDVRMCLNSSELYGGCEYIQSAVVHCCVV